MTDAQPGVTLDEIRDLARNLPGPDLEATTAIRQRLATDPRAREAGQLGEVAAFIAGWQGRAVPDLRHPRIAVFAAAHGIAADPALVPPGVETEADRIARFQAGTNLTTRACQVVDSDLRVYELGLDTATGDITRGPAMTEGEAAHAMAYGMMAVDQGLHAIGLGTIGRGGRLSAAALCCALIGGDPQDWLPVGSRPDAQRLEIESAAVTTAVGANPRAAEDPMTALTLLGGREMAAIVGTILAARLARTPVILDGFVTCAAAAMVWALDQKAIDHCLFAHRTQEEGQIRLLDRMGRTALMDYGLTGDEGAGPALALAPLKAATDLFDI